MPQQLELKELCLSAQNIRSRNNIPTVKDHWDYLLEEMQVFRKGMHLARKIHAEAAFKTASSAKRAWKRCHKPKG